MSFAPTLLVPKFLIWTSLRLVENWNLSAERDSVTPSDLIRIYLSSEYDE